MKDIDRVLVADLKRRAELGYYNGSEPGPYFHNCMGFDPSTGTKLLYTRDVGYHSSGWWKNPDYERCYHLSLSFWDPFMREPHPKDERLTRLWLKAFFGDDQRWLWCEPPYTPTGVVEGVWHYRLFCDPGWQPLKPRGEVYSREFTEVGWKSFSEVQHDRKQRQREVREQMLNRKGKR